MKNKKKTFGSKRKKKKFVMKNERKRICVRVNSRPVKRRSRVKWQKRRSLHSGHVWLYCRGPCKGSHVARGLHRGQGVAQFYASALSRREKRSAKKVTESGLVAPWDKRLPEGIDVLNHQYKILLSFKKEKKTTTILFLKFHNIKNRKKKKTKWFYMIIYCGFRLDVLYFNYPIM